VSLNGTAFFKNSIALRISREMALDFGLVEATEAEKRKRDADRAAFEAKRAAAQPRLREALAALDALDGLARDVLDLHTFDRTQPYSQTCEGCDFAGYEGDPPDWPCRTVDLIAKRHGIDLSDFYLYDAKEQA
jgi:hypothetical protein